MSKAINLIMAAALAAASLAAAVSLARLTGPVEKGETRICAERLCGVVFF
ncbi:MAG TPA: hypothetical protein PKM48_01355 [Parvularculaceae bacterium]|nr:hypothetical protein [Parvularculaceae bacterium]HNS86304.1 hypothetical protein [Parvularculaceae bacterium]